MQKLFLLLNLLFLFSCGKKEVQIANLSETRVGHHATKELAKYLNQAYTGMEFSVTDNSEAEIQFILSEQAKDLELVELPMQKESFVITQKGGKVYVVAPDERGLLNATYALLSKLGFGFYISEDVIPEPKKWTGFEKWEMTDEPLISERFLFNWHNFLSGCTGWNLEDWQSWIDQANKMRYNGIMVHAYGNNPMFSFEYLGEKKKTGYLNNTTSGRDWGNQHVNDVRRLVGGEIFDDKVFGAKASLASEENKEREATELMQEVFQYAKDRGTKVIFALDFDTWMANPRNIIEKLPREAVFELIEGHITPNPDHPEGYNYFKQVLKSLLEMYPQIDELSVWHRRPGTTAGLGSIWMSFPYEKFPDDWKKEYRNKLEDHPEIEDNLMATGTFAYGKLIAAIQKARDEIKPDLIISSGSWQFQYIPYADAMYPEDVPLIPLDWEVVFDAPESEQILANAGKNREIYPVIWAHHDDHRYIGRPYTPWENLSDRLKATNSKGFGIIHWTTHPLDLYFTSSSRQVWKNSENESLETSVKNFVNNRFNQNEVQIKNYFYTWLTTGPMFGRETSNHFVDLGKQKHGLEYWFEMAKKTKERLAMLDEIPLVAENEYLQYQKAMEEFYFSFFENQEWFEQAYQLAGENKIAEAIEVIQQANPDETIQKYADATKIIGFSPGEKALVFSMNTRWKADFLNLRQRLGIEPVRFKFSPTQHDPLAQGPGRYTYWIDQQGNWWRCLWKQELKYCCFTEEANQPALSVEENFEMYLTTIHGQALAPGTYELNFDYKAEDAFTISVSGNQNELAAVEFPQRSGQGSLTFTTGNEEVKLTIQPGKKLEVNSLILIPLNEAM